METAQPSPEQVMLIECNIDDMTGEALGFAMESLLHAGALDVWFTPIQMKKNRPAVLLSVLCAPQNGLALRQLLLQETTTLGVRWQLFYRQTAGRSTDMVQTPWGPVHRKLKILIGQVISVKPEYDDCARLARQHRISLQEIVEAAQRAPATSSSDKPGSL